MPRSRRMVIQHTGRQEGHVVYCPPPKRKKLKMANPRQVAFLTYWLGMTEPQAKSLTKAVAGDKIQEFLRGRR